MSEYGCGIVVTIPIIAIIAAFATFAFVTTLTVDVDSVDIDVDNSVYVNENFITDVVVSDDFESCNLTISFSKHFQIQNYTVKKGHLVKNNYTQVTDFSIKNLYIESVNDVNSKFILLRVISKPYHLGEGYINVKDGNNEKFKDNITIDIDNREAIETTSDIFTSVSNDINFNITTDVNLTHTWVITKDCHLFGNSSNYTFNEKGSYLVSLIVDGQENYSNVHTFNVNVTDDNSDTFEMYDWENRFVNFSDEDDEDESMNFWIILLIVLSVVGLISGYLFFEFII